MSAATGPASALAACARLRGERDAALAKVARVEALLSCRCGEANPYTGEDGRERTCPKHGDDRALAAAADLRAALNPEPTP